MRMMDRNDTVMVLVDFQTKLAPKMQNAEETEATIIRMVRAARVLGIPVIVTTQNVDGIGHTTSAVSEALGEFEEINKFTFSCMGCEEFRNKIQKTGKKTVLLTGIEAHCCVEQTCLDLLDAGYKVFVAEDCCSSRKTSDYITSIDRMRNQGAVITSYEAAAFELLKDAKAPEFKQILNIVK